MIFQHSHHFMPLDELWSANSDKMKCKLCLSCLYAIIVSILTFFTFLPAKKLKKSKGVYLLDLEKNWLVFLIEAEPFYHFILLDWNEPCSGSYLENFTCNFITPSSDWIFCHVYLDSAQKKTKPFTRSIAHQVFWGTSSGEIFFKFTFFFV